MHDRKHNNEKETGPTSLELVLQLHGEFRRSLEPIRVTPLQAGVLLFLCCHAEARVTDTAAAFRVRLPTMVEVLQDLVRKRWITKHRSVTDTRVVHLRLSRQGHALALQIEQRVRQVNATLADQDRQALGLISKGRRA